MAIQMVDLHRQYLKIKNEIDTAIQNVIASSHFIKGEEVILFENELSQYLNVKNVISCGNGTDALQIALMALDLQPGDEIITADFTFVATAEVISLLGLKPVLVDVDPDTFTIIPEKIEQAISNKTKAIIPVHLFGQAAEMEKIMEIAQKHNLYVIEDTAQALGTEYFFTDGTKKMVGTIGDIGTTSFFPSKNLGCFGDGGAIFTNNIELAEKIRMIANHGSKIKYHNDIIGVNSRLDTLQAAILSIKLKYLNEYNQNRQKAAQRYDDLLKEIKGIKTPIKHPKSTHIFHQYTLKIKNNKRDKLKEYLQKNGIPSMIYYPIPIHKQKAFRNAVYNETKLENSKKLSTEVLSLPMHTELKEIDIQFIATKIKEFQSNC